MTTGSILVSKNKKPMWAAMSKGDKAQSLSLLLLALETAVVSIADAVDEPTVITKKDVNIGEPLSKAYTCNINLLYSASHIRCDNFRLKLSKNRWEVKER